MAIRKIAQMGEPLLRQRSGEVDPSEIRSSRFQALIDDMIETMRDADGAGLAAPQVYAPLRVSVIEVNENPRYPTFEPIPLTVLVNPVLTSMVPLEAGKPAAGQAITMFEGCLSITGLRGRVRRPRKVHVRALDRHGQAFELTWEGIRAAVVQHETDHLDGILFIDRADPRTLAFLREYERHVPLAERVVDHS
jgi:peptide deformylase